MGQFNLDSFAVDASGNVTANSYSPTSATPTGGTIPKTVLAPVELEWTALQATAASVTAIHAAVTSTGSPIVVTTAFTQPSCPRNLVVDFAGTAGDIKAITVTINGFDDATPPNAVTEDFIATVNTQTTVVGSKIFASVTPSVTIPTHDGNGATTSIGVGSKLGLPYKQARNRVLRAFHNGVLEGTAPTVALSASVLSDNSVTLNTALDGSTVHVLMLV